MNDRLFLNPPDEYGEVSFFWWQGDDITKEKLMWILEQLKDKHICGLQINYCHSDRGGFQCGLTMESNPRPLSDEWWELVTWFEKECWKNGISISLSDYTLGAPGQESYMDKVLDMHPEFVGKRLKYEKGQVLFEEVPHSANPMAKGIGEAVAEEFYGAFERHMPGECGKGVNYFFSDELNFNISGKLWCDDFAEEFQKRKQYDIIPKLRALFEDIGDETPKIRMDYNDVVVQLSEEAFFKPIYQWHQNRGMTFGCDHGGRGYDVTEFGDYFRAMRWYQGPGNDQYGLESQIIKSKVSSSVAHLYQRPRVWLEGFHSSGWHVTAADVADATFRNFALGHNLLSLHGLYYSTHGSMWEWAAPCNHYHMPYWEVMGHFLECSKRLSYMLSQGVHCCDVAIVYPVASMEADEERGKRSVQMAFDTAEYLYHEGVDFDFIDFQSIERAQIKDRKLIVSKEEYQMIIIPDMRAVRFHMMQKLRDYAKKGGQVVILGEMPCESERAGRNDPVLDDLVTDVVKYGYRVEDKKEIPEIIDANFCRDFRTDAVEPYFIHRVIDQKDYYFLYRIPKGTLCCFRTKGKPVILDPWTGKKMKYTAYEMNEKIVSIYQPFSEKAVLFLEFETDNEKWEELSDFDDQYDYKIPLEGKWDVEIIPTLNNTYGDYRLPAFKGYVGAEGRECQYAISDTGIPGDNMNWQKSYLSYGTYFWVAEGNQNEEKLVQMSVPDERFLPYRFSTKTGIQGDAGPQGSYHGLKGKMTDEFLAFGKKKITYYGSSSEYYGEGPYYVFTNVYADTTIRAELMHGTLKPEKIWIDHKEISTSHIDLEPGLHPILLKYPEGGRTYFVVRKTGEVPFIQNIPLAMTWYQNPTILPFDACPDYAGKKCWYKMLTPPGTKALHMTVNGEIEGVWLNGKKMNGENGKYRLDSPARVSGQLVICLCQKQGCYDTAAFVEPVQFECEEGTMDLNIPLEDQGLKFYSGCICFKKQVDVERKKGRTALELKNREFAYKICVNGTLAGIKISEPDLFEITDYIHEGKNTIEVYAYNTLYNHMLTIPTNFNWWKKRNWINEGECVDE